MFCSEFHLSNRFHYWKQSLLSFRVGGNPGDLDLVQIPHVGNGRMRRCGCSLQLLFRAFKWKRWGEGEVAQSCPTLCDPVDCNLLDFSVRGILQARILEWIAISFSRGSSWPRDRTQVSRIGGRRFNLWATREALVQSMGLQIVGHAERLNWTEVP